MKKPLVIFGCGDIAELALYYFTTDSEYEVIAFTVDTSFKKTETFCGLPVIPFENISDHFPPELYSLFIALSYSKINAVRKEKFNTARRLGYTLASYISSRATLLSTQAVGQNWFILEDNTIQPFVKLGDNVTLWSGNHIGHHSTIASHTFIASHAVISGGVDIGESCFIGVNATLRDHITIGERCVVGANALLLRNAEPDGVYIGNSTERSRVPSSKLRGI